MQLLDKIKDHRYFLLVYGSIYTIFLWPLLIFKRTFIYGDYWQQHYPWSVEYGRLLKLGQLPYWLPQVSSGLPLVAEGQVGAYYPLHLILYFLLPAYTAYTAGILIHVLIGGVGFYLYGRRSQRSEEAATWMAVLFSFSSAYGGCFSNTAVLRVMAWLPWCLIVWNGLIASRAVARFRRMSVLSVLFFMMGTAGASQMALYSVIYMTILCLWVSKGKGWIEWFFAGAIAAVLSLPQWMSTLELMRVSTRAGEGSAFSLWGSVLPPAMIAPVFPQWGMFLGAAFYVSAAGALLFALTLFSKKCRLERIHLWMVLLFVLVALGSYGPFFWLGFGFFRNPSKWLFFSTISSAVVIGFAWDRLRRAASDPVQLASYKRGSLSLCVAVSIVPLIAQMIYAWLKDDIQSFATKSAEAVYAGKSDPFFDLSHYQEKASALSARLEGLIAYTNPWNLIAIGFFLLSGLVLWLGLRKNAGRYWLRWALPVVMIADLVVFGSYIGAGFTGNARDYPPTLDPQIVSSIKDQQMKEQSLLASWEDERGLEYLPSNTNLLYGINHAGGYTPLMIRRYYDLTKELGIVDSSLGRRPIDPDVWDRQSSLVRALGIGQILTKQGVRDVSDPAPYFWAVNDWEVIGDEAPRLAYLRSNAFQPSQRSVIEVELPDLEKAPEAPPAQIRIRSWDTMRLSLDVDSDHDTLLNFRSVYYPGWKAEVDGVAVRVLAVNHAFSGLSLKRGHHQVEYFYDIQRMRVWEMIAAFGAIILLIVNGVLWRKRVQ